MSKNGNGQGTIYYNEKLKIYIGQYTNQQGKRKTVKQKKNEKVSDFKNRFYEIKNADAKGTLIEKSSETIISILEKHIEYKHNNNITAGRTYLRDKGTIEQIKKYCSSITSISIQKITVSDIQSITPNLTIYAQNTIDKIWRFIKKAFQIAMSDRLITYNPMENLNIAKPKSNKATKQIEALTIDEHQKFINVLNSFQNQYNDILLFQVSTGMRIGEVLALSYDCIDLKNNQITIYRTLTRDSNDKVVMGKSAKTKSGVRTIFITPPIQELCNKLLNNKLKNIENLIFWDYKDNKYISPGEINDYLRRLNQKYNICNNLHTHKLRHTYATRFIEAGGSAKVLQTLLGHKDIETTLNTYTSVFDNFTEKENQKYIDYLKELGL